MEDILLITALFLIFMSLSAFFSAAETALTAASLPFMQQRAKENDKLAILVLKLLSSREKLISISLICNNGVNILGSSYLTYLVISKYGEASLPIASLFLTIFIIMFGEIIPKQIALLNANRLSLFIAYPYLIITTIFNPLVIVVEYFSQFVIKKFTPESTHATDIEAELRGLIEMHRGDPEINEERRMLRSILELDDISVEKIMTHDQNVFKIPTTMPIKQAINEIIKSKYSKIPLYDPNKADIIIGVIHVRNLIKSLNNNDKIDLIKVATKPVFVLKHTSLLKQIKSFRSTNEHFAVVVDEYGHFEGILTLEDIIEEIIGDIDSSLTKEKQIEGVVHVADNEYILDGEVPVRLLNREFEWDLPDEYATTIAGLVIHHSKKIPNQGDIFDLHNFTIQIISKNRHKITQLKVIVNHEPQS